MRALHSLADEKDRSCADVDHLARAQLEAIEQKITDLTALRDELCDLLDHCRIIVTYSAGQWAGTRAAVAMRPFFSELGCLPVSAMVHVPEAHTVFDEAGAYLEENEGARWGSYIERGLDQLAWWAEAAADQRKRSGEATEAFTRDPTQRNAP